MKAKDNYQIILPSECKLPLEAVALSAGYLWGERGNVKAYFEDLIINKSATRILFWSEARITELERLFRLLRDQGDNEGMRIIADILLERPELSSSPMRTSLEKYQSHSITPWSAKIQELISQQIPFQLSYRDATDSLATYTIRYAEIVQRERHQYLDAWVEETDFTRDLPELAHNRSFRFDRITNAGVAPIEGEWRSAGLDTVVVEFHLSGRLAHAYEPRGADIDDSWLHSVVPTRMVARRISRPFG